MKLYIMNQRVSKLLDYNEAKRKVVRVSQLIQKQIENQLSRIVKTHRTASQNYVRRSEKIRVSKED